MEKEKIKKALECCHKPLASDCNNCGYRRLYIEYGDHIGCSKWLIKDALTLINSQEQRIKELTEEAENWRIDAENYRNELAEVQAERKKWEEAYDSDCLEFIDKCDRLNEELTEILKVVNQIEKEIKGKRKEKECPNCQHFVGCESYGRICGKYMENNGAES